MSIKKEKMMSKYEELNTSTRILMGPGPSDVHPRVLRAMATPLIGHLDPEFLKIMDEIKEMVQLTLQTRNQLTFVVSAPGSAGMETCLVNLLGQPIDPQQVRKVLKQCKPKLVAIVHAETSTGVLQPLEEISRMTHEAGALFVVDAVTSYCGIAVKVDDWGIDAIYSGSQKCLSAPPGLSPVSFSPDAVKALEKRKTKAQSWFLDLSLVRNYWTGAKRAYHHTAPVSALFAFREALRLVLEEGLEERFKRHQRNHILLREGLEALGFEFLVDSDYRLPMLNAVKLPPGVEDAATRKRLLDEFNIEVGGGLGDFAGKIWRVGLMGNSSNANHINSLLGALKSIL
jgi:alanine-glyoxylate transaminase/serine-glyoxylate transaminase/serine-pyruvate transaminase